MTADIKGSGSIVQRDKSKPKSRCRKWQLRASLGKDYATGRYVLKTKEFSGTYTEAKSALRDFISELEKGEAPIRRKTTFAEYADRWHGERVESGNFAERTLSVEEIKLRNLKKHLGNAPIARLAAKDYEKAYAALRKGQSLSGKPLSGKTLSNIHKTLVTLLRAAEKEGAARPGTADAIKPPKIDSRERRPPSSEQVANLLASLDPEKPMHILVMVCTMCGLRRSEALALTWRDWSDGALRVDKSLGDDGGVKDVKTASGNRTVPCPQVLEEALGRRKAAQELAMGRAWMPDAPIVSATGKRVLPHSASSWWRKTGRREFGLECTLHDLRHAYMTMLAQAGVDPRTMQELAGHSSPAISIAVYTHARDEQKRKAAAALDGLLGE